jgi:uncharacterized protein (DUF433 family)
MRRKDIARYLGVGLYSVPDAARLIGAQPSTLRGWVRADRSSVGGVGRRGPVMVHHLDHRGWMLTFPELVGLLVVKSFRAAGVPLSTITEVAEEAERTFETPHPLAVQQFGLQGHRVFAALLERRGARGKGTEDLTKGLRAFETAVRPLLRQLDYRDGAEAVRFWPMGRAGRVVLDPERRFGKPIDADTGVATETLFDAVNANPDLELAAVAGWLEVPPAAVEAAVAYERSLRRERVRLTA